MSPPTESLPSVPSPNGEAEQSLPVSLLRLPTPALPQELVVPVMPEPSLGSVVAGAASSVRAAKVLGTAMKPAEAAPAAPQDQSEQALPLSASRNTTPTAGSDAVASAENPVVRGATSSANASGASSVPTALPARTASSELPTTPSQPSGSSRDQVSAGSSPPAASVASTAVASAGAATNTGTNTGSGGSVSAAKQGQSSTGKTRMVYARVGDDITIALNGSGWIFTGGGPTGRQWKNGVQYETRSSDSGGTTFAFKAKQLGSWVLEFQQQDSATGATSEETIDLHVLSDQEFARTIASKGAALGGGNASAGGPGQSSVAGLARADWLYKEGKYKEALSAYEAAWQPNDPALTDKIAALAYQVGQYADAHKYWKKNFNLTGTTYGELAVAGLMKTATAQRNAPELRALFGYVHALNGVPIRTDLLATGEYLYQARDWEVAVRYLEEYLSRYDGQEGADVADFLLGQVYEGDTPMQDAQKALAYYRRVVAYYPTSDYYERAKANINYLNRHFFEIR